VADTELIAQALLSRQIPSVTPPLTSREFWSVTRMANLGDLPGLTSAALSAGLGVDPSLADRIPALLERSRALALATEELEHKGFWVLTSESEHYPRRLRERLGDHAPALLHGVGDQALLARDGIGVVGSRDVPPDAIRVARDIARVAVKGSLPVVSGAARGVDQHAMSAALEDAGDVVGVLADSLLRAASDRGTREAVTDGRVCLVTPYAPTAPFSAGNAMGRNKIIYGLSRAVVVVRSDKDTGGTWAGATEALSKRFATVYSWIGDGAGPGNAALVARGARILDADSRLDEILLADPIAVTPVAAPESVEVPLF
jgi:predicted Rossmann fold nucleotide-binding protein DprA/Smf involved in DNA uptake